RRATVRDGRRLQDLRRELPRRGASGVHRVGGAADRGGRAARCLSVALPFGPPVEPMLAKLATELPEGEGWLYEPKWDGFRALAFRDGDELYLQSRDLKPLNRYFPELIEPLLQQLPRRCVLDGEIVIAGPQGLDFDALLLRIHPAASRIKLLAAQTPASYVAFDLLAAGDEDLR